MTSNFSTGTIVTATVGTAATLALGYAVYFDHRRRTDPEFRRELKRQAKRSNRAQKEQEASARAEQRQRIKDVIEEANAEAPISAQETEQAFFEHVEAGEKLSAKDPFEAAVCFYRAMKVYPHPKEMLGIYDRTVQKPVLDILATIIAQDPKLDTSAAGSGSGSDNGSMVNVE